MQKTRKFLLRLCLCVTLAAGFGYVICLYAGHKRAEKDRQEALKTVEGGDSSAKPLIRPLRSSRTGIPGQIPWRKGKKTA